MDDAIGDLTRLREELDTIIASLQLIQQETFTGSYENARDRVEDKKFKAHLDRSVADAKAGRLIEY